MINMVQTWISDPIFLKLKFISLTYELYYQENDINSWHFCALNTGINVLHMLTYNFFFKYIEAWLSTTTRKNAQFINLFKSTAKVPVKMIELVPRAFEEELGIHSIKKKEKKKVRIKLDNPIYGNKNILLEFIFTTEDKFAS